MLNNSELFTSPDKCIEECDKQIEFSKSIIAYLEQYINHLQSIKVMAQSAKSFQQINPFAMMMEFMNNQTKKKDDE